MSVDLPDLIDLLPQMAPAPVGTDKVPKVWFKLGAGLLFSTWIDPFPCPVCGVRIDGMGLDESEIVVCYWHVKPVAGSTTHGGPKEWFE